MTKVDLSVDLCGIKLGSPTVLASGVLGVSTATMKRVYENGCGAITLKSISHEPRNGNHSPTIIATEHFMMNAVGLSGVGVENAAKTVKALKAVQIPVIASIFSDTTEKTAEVGAKFESYGADALEINVSCPHVQPGENFGITIGTKPDLVEQVTAAVKRRTSLPVIVKLTPNVTDIVEIAKAAVSAGADALCAVNTFGPGMKIDIETAQPILFNRLGGVSGPGIFPLALAIIYRLAKAVEVPIIAMGGVTNAQDAIEMLLAGATAVGLGTAVYYEGVEVFNKVNTGITEYMTMHGYKSISDFRGLALNN